MTPNSEAEVLSVLNAPDRINKVSTIGANAYKLVGNRLLKATYVEEEGDVIVVTVIGEQASENSDEDRI